MTDRKIPGLPLFYLLSLVCLTPVLLAPFSVPAKESIPVKMCYEEQELEPYFMGTGPLPPKQYPGIFIEMMYQLDATVPQISVELHRVPWKRCLNELKQNISDVVIASYQSDRETFGVYPSKDDSVDESLAISTSQYCLFTKRNSSLTWNGIRFSLLPEKPVAVPQGYSIVSMLEDNRLPLVFTNSSVAAMDLLKKSLASAAVTYCEAGGNYLWKNAAINPGVIAQSPTLSSKNGYLVFSRDFYNKHTELTERLWREAAHIRDTRFSKLLHKYEARRFED